GLALRVVLNEQKTLAVCRDLILIAATARRRPPGVEENPGSSRLKRRRQRDVDREDAPVGREIEELLSVGPPPRRGAALRGDRPSGCRPWKLGHEDFDPARLLGGVRDPMPIGREPRIAGASPPLEERKRGTATDGECRKDDHPIAPSRAAVEDDVSAVRGPVARPLVRIRRQNEFLG